MTKKVLFVSATNLLSVNENRVRPLWPAFLAAYAEKQLGSGALEFCYGAGDIGSLLKTHSPDLLCISTVTQNYDYACRYAAAARGMGIPVLLGGMHISSLPTSLTRDMTVACIGEGERTFVDLLSLYLDKGCFPIPELRKVQGVAFREGETIVEIPMRPTRLEIDDLPHPKRSLIGYGRRGYVYTARGCPYKCVFCSCTRFWGAVRYASPQYIVEELHELIDHGARVIRFADENFIANKPRLEALARLIAAEGINRKVKFSCWCRANNVTAEVVSLLKAINVVSVKLGLESGNNRMLEYLKGGVTVEDNRRAVSLLSKAGMQVNADFLFGAPDETEGEILDTYRFAKRSPIAFFDVNIFSPLPGTPVWNLAKKKGLVSDTEMRWSRLNYKFISDPREAIVLSETLTHAQLSLLHKKFQRLRLWKGLWAFPKSPWRNEIPMLVLKKLAEIVLKRLIKTKMTELPKQPPQQ
jgi:radical SAM superfamily enzyme YgiQ (UPF0313 family)